MQQMTLLDLLNEYLILGYPDCPKIPYTNIDIELGDLSIARWNSSFCKVIYLTNGDSLLIQKELIRLCNGFYDKRGDEIVRIKETPGSSLWELIIASKRILGKKSVDPRRLKDTTDLRTWLKNNHNIIIEPILYNTHNEIIVI